MRYSEEIITPPVCHQLSTENGGRISLHVFHPEVSNNKLLVINSATGVRQQLYFGLAGVLSQNGFTVITYDYQGIGLSAGGKLRQSSASMRSWGSNDFSAITRFVTQEFPHHRKFCLGHSVGALILGLNGDSLIFEKFIFVATQDAYLGYLKPMVALNALLGFGLAVPVSTALMGYFPARFFGLGNNLPKKVARDWRTLILNKNSTRQLFKKQAVSIAQQLRQPVAVIDADDDHWITDQGIHSLLTKTFPYIRPSFITLKSADSPRGSIGHINFFRKYNRPLWTVIIEQLDDVEDFK